MRKLFTILFIVFTSFFISTAQGLWTKRASLPDTVRGAGMSFSVGNYGYIGVGYNQLLNIYFNDLWQFNPSTNSWLPKARFPGVARIWPQTFVIGHKVYVVSGQDDNENYTSECWVYDANTDKWTQKNNFPGQPRGYGVGFSIGNRGFIGLGSKWDSAYCKDFWEYDTTSDTWTKKADFGQGTWRIGANGFGVGGKGYICFGFDTINGTERDIWEYDTTSNTWTQKASYSDSGAYVATGFVIGSNIYVGTGAGQGNIYLKTMWKFNTLNNTWKKQADFPAIARVYDFSFAIADSGYMGLGIDSVNNNYSDFYKFYPDTLTGVNEINIANNNPYIYPNPFNIYTDIYISNITDRNTIKVDCFDMLGRSYEVENSITNAGNNIDIRLSRGALPNGVYIIKVTGSNSIYYNRVIIN